MDKMDAISTLKFFNEKVDKLINSRFVKHIQENKGLKVSIKSSVGEKVDIFHNLPDQDAIDAFVLTVRFFIQDNEPTSLRNMAKLYNEVPVAPEIKDDFNYVRDKLNSELSKKSTFTLQDRHLTRGEIFDTFIYGGLAHAEAKKKEDPDVQEKKKTAEKYCELVSKNIGNFGIVKSWRYVIVPTEKITISSTVAGLLAK